MSQQQEQDSATRSVRLPSTDEKKARVRRNRALWKSGPRKGSGEGIYSRRERRQGGPLMKKETEDERAVRSEVFVLRDPYTEGGQDWRAVYLGTVMRPHFNSKSAAQAYLDGLLKGTRKPEYSV